MTFLLEGVMPQRYQVVIIAEGYHTLAVNFWHWEEVLENVDNSFAELAGEVVEDQVRVCL